MDQIFISIVPLQIHEKKKKQNRNNFPKAKHNFEFDEMVTKPGRLIKIFSFQNIIIWNPQQNNPAEREKRILKICCCIEWSGI